MVDVYRAAAEQCRPACMHCMTAQWMAFDKMWCLWICQVYGEECPDDCA